MTLEFIELVSNGRLRSTNTLRGYSAAFQQSNQLHFNGHFPVPLPFPSSTCRNSKRKGKEEYLYSACLHQGTRKALRHGSHSFTCKQTPCLPFLRGVRQMSPQQQLRQQTSNCSSLLIYRPRKDERLSWPSWLTYSGWLTHISGHPSATSRAQDSESTSAEDQCSAAGPRNQHDTAHFSCG